MLRFTQGSAFDFAKNRLHPGVCVVGGSCIVKQFTVAPTTERQTSQLRLALLFRQKQKAVRDTHPDGQKILK